MKIGKVALDTNIVIGLLEGDVSIVNKLDLFTGDLFIPIIVLGELRFGAFNSKHIEENLEKIESVKTRCGILQINDLAATEYGNTKSYLRKQGTPIPDNDIWIAALAIQYECALITRDEHFKNVTALSVAMW
jgi:tRNA(fMet)-specific endonuclease VapC